MSFQIVDFQWIKLKSKILIKEFSVFNLADDHIDNYNIRHPYQWISNDELFNYNWIMKYHHQLPLVYGDFDFTILDTILKPESIIFLKGSEKMDILSEIFPNEFHNLEHLGCDSHVLSNSPVCNFYKHNNLEGFSFCSLKKVYSYAHWLKKYTGNQ